MKVFIAGARAIISFTEEVDRKLMAIAKKEYEVLIGDAKGADLVVQKFYADLGYQNVSIFASEGKARNNLGDWKVESISVEKKMKGFDFYKQKDIAMARVADCGFMIWNGQSKGTLNNMINLAQEEKTCMVYLEIKDQFFTIRNESDLLNLISQCPSTIKSTYRKLKKDSLPNFKQITMF